MDPKPQILINGASIAGPVLAHFLSQSHISITILERSPNLRTTGQQVDIRGSGLTVIQRMGLEEAVRSRTTEEAGLQFVTGNGKPIATFPVDKETGMSFSSDIEILRGELAKVIYEKTVKSPDIEYIFGDYVTAFSDTGKKVTVTLASGKEREFDLVIGADGMTSKTRRLAFPRIQDPLKPLGQYMAFFTIPYQASDGTFARWYNAPGGRTILLRPDKAGCTRAYFAIMSSKPEGYEKMSEEEQKKMWRNLFQDAGWEAERVLEGMEKSEDWYMQEIAQIKMPTWHEGRVGLVGDAAYCPSPISGMGTSLAIVGAYVLAGEIVKNGNGRDFEKAFEGYEERMRGYVDKAQKLPPGAPGFANPQTRIGISILNGVLGFVSWSGLATLFSKLSLGATKERDDLPEYAF
ncbi:FAD/NAD(P)-binding domain-containing protein [Mollisia scopiformis]|uniref:FAD/NAD(P)-binding domain-containing protein n=1 Tax=Mollisia scopiformis TaxID=149040 RepID=A0A194XSQ2_MOLSC|nr:FAD/NAD(P)-binding domain-containing protein [Mollisia scopiformis]KUJ23171.1 FAD/NAD(P)-binding domain-containing protein [Mollisia scopiformis]